MVGLRSCQKFQVLTHDGFVEKFKFQSMLSTKTQITIHFFGQKIYVTTHMLIKKFKFRSML